MNLVFQILAFDTDDSMMTDNIIASQNCTSRKMITNHSSTA